MKKVFLLLASAVLFLIGCNKEQLSNGEDGGMITATFTANLESGVATRAAADGDGAAAKVNRCIMEIYYGDALYARQISKVTDKQATFNAQVVSNRGYTVAFWADCVDNATSDAGLAADKYYNTASLKEITIKGSYIGNDDARDAFYVCEPFTVQQTGGSFSATLKRPFAQMNVITTDWDKVVTVEALKPEKVNVTLKNAMVVFNAVTGEASGSQDITYEAAVYTAPAPVAPVSATDKTLSMDYLFASATKGVIDIDWKALHGTDTDVEHTFAAVPYQRNFRTNIKGALLTTQGQWTVTVDSDWNQPDEEVKFVEAGSVAAANEAFANGATSVKITSVGEETTLYLPQTTKEVTIDFANPSEVITVQYGPAPTKAAGEKPAVVNIATNNVTKFTVTGISNIVWLAGNQAALTSALNNAVAGQTVALANDITMTENWVSVARGSNTPNFDGRNHAIINMTIKTQEESYAGLFSTIKNHVILQNVTFRNALIDIPASFGDNARGGVLAGHMYPSDVVNCHVEGATIKAHQKMGGLIGYVEGDAANKTISIKDCSVKDITLSSNVQGSKTVAGVGGLIGHLVLSQADLITVENNSVENITITDSEPMIEPYNYDDYGQYLPHAFIGNACQNYKGEEAISESKHSIVLKNNRVLGTNTELSTCIYSSEYFGWGGNAEDNPTWKGKIYIDGQEWGPNYPFKNVTTGKGYATLGAALAALQQGETLEIWEAGEYTVETLKSPANSTIDAKVEGVVFNHTAVASSWIASDAVSGRTVKNITWNIGNANYQALHVANLVGCTINGRFYPHGGPATYTDCVFNAPGYDYCLWTWNNDATFKSCTFNTQGKAVNVYGAEDHTYVFEDCVFNATNIQEGKGKAAIFVKDGVDNDNKNAKVNVSIKNCTANYERPYNQLDPDDVPYSESVLWNVEIGQYSSTNEMSITLDGEKVYPFTKFKVNDVAGLRNAVKMFNAGKEKVEYSIELADGTYEVSDMPIIQAAKKSLVVKAKNEGKAILTPDAGTKTNMIFLISGGGLSTTGDEWVTFEGLKFNMPNDPGKITSAVFCTTQNDATYSPLVGESMTRYAHNITVRNCELQGCGSENSSLLKAAQGAGANIALVDNCFVNHSGYVVSDYFSNVSIVNTKVTDTKACANIANVGITVEGCDISTYHDYCIRTNGGAVVVKDNTFTMTYDGAATDAGIVVLRGTGDQASISGNTITKAVNTMWDCYCAKAWTVNGEAKAAGTGINF